MSILQNTEYLQRIVDSSLDRNRFIVRVVNECIDSIQERLHAIFKLNSLSESLLDDIQKCAYLFIIAYFHIFLKFRIKDIVLTSLYICC